MSLKMIEREYYDNEVFEEHNVWRKNVPYMYDLMFSYALKWPSLSVQYFPDSRRDDRKESTSQRLLLSTNTNGEEQEYIHIASVEFPDKYDELLSDDCNGDLRFKFEQSIPVHSSINVVRYNPVAFHLLAARFDTEDIHIFDYTKHLATSEYAEPDVVLKGHSKGGYGLCWNPLITSELATAGEDNKICIFNITESSKNIRATAKLKYHSKIVNEISYNYNNDTVLASVSDDKSLIIWDTKIKKPSYVVSDAHESDILSCHFSPLNSFYLATSSEDRSVKIWDTRNLSTSVYTLLRHSSGCGKVQWSPHFESILASAGKDKRVCMWDLSLYGNILSEEDTLDGPPELMFLHGGHTDNVVDISWNPAEIYEIASVSEDNVLQIWQIPERE